MMTRQEVFTRVFQHFIFEGGLPSINKVTETCYYFHPQKDASCAIGCLLPKEWRKDFLENPDDNGQGVYGLLHHGAHASEISQMLSKDDESFYVALQSAHDGVAKMYPDMEAFRKEMRQELCRIANDYNLFFPDGPSYQFMFNKVWQAFVVEKKQRSTVQGTRSCMYFSNSGNRCAVGWLLPESMKTTLDEGVCNTAPVEELLGKVPEVRSFIGNDSAFLRNLQDCHDDPAGRYLSGAAFTSAVKRRLKDFAKVYKLTIPA